MPSTVSGLSHVRWGSGAHVFELRSADPRAIDRAARVFEPWMAAAAGRDALYRWSVAHDARTGAWTIEGDCVAEPLQRDRLEQAITAVEYLAVSALAEDRQRTLALHGGLVARNGEGVLVLGAPESGKSTLVTALWQRGFTLLGDDLTVIDAASRSARTVPRRVSLRNPSRPLVGEGLWSRIAASPSVDETAGGVLFHPHEIDGVDRSSAVVLRLCVFLNRTAGGAATSPARLSPAASVLALLPYTNAARWDDPGLVIPRLAPLASGVRAYDMTRAGLDTMHDAITRLLEMDD